MGTRDGSIIATIITTHMPRNDAAAPVHVFPGIRIHAIDIVQPPGIGISPIADMRAHQTIVTATLTAKSSAETPKKACCDARSEAMRREISRLCSCATTATTSLSAWRTRRGGPTTHPFRCAPWERGRATGTCPRGRPVRAHRWSRCGRRCRPRAGCASRGVVGPEHEVVDEELRAPSEEVGERGASLVGLESVGLFDADPRQLLPPPRQLVAAPRVLLLRLEQLYPRCEPVLPCPGHVLRHCCTPFVVTIRWLSVTG